jgi:catechol 2,3-dioxygenase-like lactoylglutathione lyase family enzyme
MTMSTTITGIHTVAVPVADQDRALRFYAGPLGFGTRLDAEIGPGMRWIEVAPADAPVTLALTVPLDGRVGVDTGIRLTATDIDAEHAALTGHGVDVDEILRWPDVPAMFSFRDPDGNTLYLVETVDEDAS